MSIILWGRKKRTLASLTQVMHIGIVVDVCIDRPSTHSDGGAWIDRCQALSWYTETLGGDRWLPAQATIAAAWTAAGSATGAVFQASATAGPLTSGRFYAATSATTATEVFRGIKREYPRAGVAWVAESGRVIGYDLRDGSMWMVVSGIGVWPLINMLSADGVTKYIVAKDGIVITKNTMFSFIKDSAFLLANSIYKFPTNIAQRDTLTTPAIISSGIIDFHINDVAITTLENSPIDPATGMPVPTIAVATDGGVSVIKDDSTVVNDTSNWGGIVCPNVAFDKYRFICRTWRDGAERAGIAKVQYPTSLADYNLFGVSMAGISTFPFTDVTPPAFIGINKNIPSTNTINLALYTKLVSVKVNPQDRSKSMMAFIANSYATGWQIGDSRLATICAADGVTESVVGGTIPDRSVKNVSLNVNGTLTKTKVAAGAALCALSGFSAANYLWQPYSANHDYSTTGFGGAFWLKEAPNSAIEYILNRDSLTPAQAIRLWVSVAGFLVFELYDGTTTRTATGTVAVDDSTPKLVQFDYLAGTMNVYVNTALYATATGAALLTLSNAAALLNVGLKVDGTLPLTNGSLALFRMSPTIASAEQREQIYRDELPLFQPGAQCTLAGTSPAVTALAFDDTTDILHAATSYGRSSFKNLLRVESEATTVGAPTAIAASGGSIVLAGTSAKLYRPEISFYE